MLTETQTLDRKDKLVAVWNTRYVNGKVPYGPETTVNE